MRVTAGLEANVYSKQSSGCILAELWLTDWSLPGMPLSPWLMGLYSRS